jgi:hypothetical protein
MVMFLAKAATIVCKPSCCFCLILIKPEFYCQNLVTSFMKIHPAGAKMFHVDGQTGMTKPDSLFWTFWTHPKANKIHNPNITHSLHAYSI